MSTPDFSDRTPTVIVASAGMAALLSNRFLDASPGPGRRAPVYSTGRTVGLSFVILEARNLPYRPDVPGLNVDADGKGHHTSAGGTPDPRGGGRRTERDPS